MQYPFLGRGWAFPPVFDRNLPGAKMLEDEEDIASSLVVLLGTAQGERVMMPWFGCNLDELIFESLDTRIKTLVADKIESAILYHESRIRLEKVSIEKSDVNEGILLISIDYVVKTTNSRFNLVWPFYIQEGTDIDMAITVNPLGEN
jgi:uncharacterized protein